MNKQIVCKEEIVSPPCGCGVSLNEINVGDPYTTNFNTLVFEENFNARWFDNYSQCSIWDHGFIPWGYNLYVNDEVQRYSRQSEFKNNLPFSDSIIDGRSVGGITSTYLEQHERSTLTKRHNNEPVLREPEYLSGIFTTRQDSLKQFGFGHGKIEINAKITNSTGDFGAFWFLKRQQFNQWETEFLDEIDILEWHGHNQRTTHQTVHFNTDSGFETIGNYTMHDQDLSQDYHRYGLEWNNKNIGWYIDGLCVHVINTPLRLQENFDMNLIINLAHGGSWSDFQIEHDKKFNVDNGPPKNTSTLYLDYIKFYQ